MSEGDMLHETDHNVPFLRPKASLYDDYKSYLLLESNFVGDTPLTNLEEVA